MAKAEQVKKNENLSFGAAGAAIKRSAAAIAAEESRAETLRADESDSRPKKVAPTRPLRIVLEAREQSTTPPADPDDKP